MERDSILRSLAAGEISIDEAQRLLDSRDNVLEQIRRFGKTIELSVEITEPRRLDDSDVWGPRVISSSTSEFALTDTGNLLGEKGRITSHFFDVTEDKLEDVPDGLMCTFTAYMTLQFPGFFGTREEKAEATISIKLFPENPYWYETDEDEEG